MRKAEIVHLSPAASLTDFLITTQLLTWQQQDNVKLVGHLMGQTWIKDEAEKIDQFAQDNCRTAGEYIGTLHMHGIAPRVRTNEGIIGSLGRVGLDDDKVYHLSALVAGQPRDLTIGSFALIDRTDVSPQDSIVQLPPNSGQQAQPINLLVPPPIISIPGNKLPFIVPRGLPL